MATNNAIQLRPELQNLHPIWSRIKVLIENDESKYTSNAFCFKLPNETDQSFNYRKSIFSTGFINPTNELLTAPGSIIFGADNRQEFTDETGRLKLFGSNIVRSQSDPMGLVQFLKDQFTPNLRGYGTVFLLMDMPGIGGNVSEEQQRANRVWPYLTLLNPLSVVNYEFVDGELAWFAWKVTSRDDWADPTQMPPKEEEQERIWTREEYIVRVAGTVKLRIPNPFNFVPVIIQAAFRPTMESVLGTCPFFVSSNMIIMANNLRNISNMVVMKHGTPTLLFPKQALTASNQTIDDVGDIHLKQLPDGGVMTYDGDKEPAFLSNDLGAVAPAKEMSNEYMAMAYDNEKSAKSVGVAGMGGDDAAASGFAKVIDREPIIANIVSTALDVQSAHRKILGMADRIITGTVAKVPAFTVQYDMKYDIKPLSELLDNASKVRENGIQSPTLHKELQKLIAAKIIEDQKILAVANDEIEKSDVLGRREPDADLMDAINGTDTDDDTMGNTDDTQKVGGADGNVITDAQTSLNGAQVTAVLEVVNSVAEGLLPRESAIAILMISFAISKQNAEAMMSNIGKGFKPKVPEEKKPVAQEKK